VRHLAPRGGAASSADSSGRVPAARRSEVEPCAPKFFTVFTVLTLGIAYLLAFITRIIVSAIVLMIVDKFTRHLTIDGFRWALLGAIMMSLIGTLAQWLLLGLRAG